MVWGSLNCQTADTTRKKIPSPQMLKETRTYLLHILYILGVINLFQQINLPNYMYNVHYGHGETIAYL